MFGSKILLYLLNSLFPFYNPSISFYRQCCDSGKLSKYMKYEYVIGVAYFVTTALATALGFSYVDPLLEVGFFVFVFFFFGGGGGVSFMVGFDFCEMVVVLGFFVFLGCWVFLEFYLTIEWNSMSNIYSFQLHTVSYHLKNHAISIANILVFSTRVFLSKSFTILTNMLLDLDFLCFFF